MEETSKKYIISGRVIDSTTFNPLYGVKVYILSKGNNYKEISTKTNKKGEYELAIYLELKNGKINEKPPIYFEFEPNYSKNNIIPFTQKGELISTIPIVKLKPIKQDLEEQKSTLKQLDNNIVKKATNLLPKSPEESLINFIKTQIKLILSILIPTVLTMLAAFGIDKFNELIKNNNNSYCPKQNKLNELINKRNQIVEQLNNLSKTIDILIKAVGIVQGLSVILLITANVILAIPLPAALVPQSVIQIGADVVQYAKKLASKFSSISITVLISLLLFKAVISMIINLLLSLYKLLLICNPSSDLISLDSNLVLIKEEIEKLSLNREDIPETESLNREDIPETDISLIRKINGFTLEISIIEKNSIGNLQRKQAIATNSQGIILLKGEPSFSASEQILLDELEFYIKSNNLKAY